MNRLIKPDVADSPYQIVFCTCDATQAEDIATCLVKSKLAACVNINAAMQSVYYWENSIETATEVLLIIKTQTHLLDALEKLIIKLHHYDCPEIIALPLSYGNHDYLRWISQNTLASTTQNKVK